MSDEQLKAFIAKVQADTSLQEQLKADGADVVAIAKAAGFSITAENLAALWNELSENQSENLSTQELEAFAGGVNRLGLSDWVNKISGAIGDSTWWVITEDGSLRPGR